MTAALAARLRRLEQISHPGGIALGLDRVTQVGERMGVLQPPVPVVTVGGTNGKGSTVAFLDAALRAAGYRSGVYTSPHLRDFRERICIGGEWVAADALIEAFDAVESARGDVALTYFEFTTLAAFHCFLHAAPDCDVWVLEVGLGGRLDAVNAVDADVSIVTRVARDHVDYLGDDLDGIGREKAGIFRSGRPGIIGQTDPPAGLLEAAAASGARVLRADRDFSLRREADAWHWDGVGRTVRVPVADSSLFAAANAGGHAASALAALTVLEPKIRVPDDAFRAAFRAAAPPGRLERCVLAGVEWLFDVAHNADAAAWLRRALDGPTRVQGGAAGKTRAIVGAARRKDLDGIVDAVRPAVDVWYLPEFGLEEMIPGTEAATKVRAAGGTVASAGVDVESTLQVLRDSMEAGDRVVVFGSFRTVEAVRDALGDGPGSD